MTQVTTATAPALKTGTLNLPLEKRGKCPIEHKTPLQILDESPAGHPGKMKVLIKGRELHIPVQYISTS